MLTKNLHLQKKVEHLSQIIEKIRDLYFQDMPEAKLESLSNELYVALHKPLKKIEEKTTPFSIKIGKSMRQLKKGVSSIAESLFGNNKKFLAKNLKEKDASIELFARLFLLFNLLRKIQDSPNKSWPLNIQFKLNIVELKNYIQKNLYHLTNFLDNFQINETQFAAEITNWIDLPDISGKESCQIFFRLFDAYLTKQPQATKENFVSNLTKETMMPALFQVIDNTLRLKSWLKQIPTTENISPHNDIASSDNNRKENIDHLQSKPKPRILSVRPKSPPPPPPSNNENIKRNLLSPTRPAPPIPSPPARPPRGIKRYSHVRLFFTSPVISDEENSISSSGPNFNNSHKS
ncbi:MAG: hypothetical protein REH83_05715 [Rickettsiella sp.]|nr:hypothetical protein [Rickettsiella sp.]